MQTIKLKKLSLLFGIVIIALFNSCSSGVIIDKSKKVENALWNSADVIKFTVPIADTTQRYNFYINIRNSSDYQYSNIFLFLKTFYPNGMLSVDTIECILADDKGKWMGKERGKLIDNRILFRKGIRFRLAGNYSFEFEQAMREKELKGIEDFGIRIDKFESEK